MASSPGSSMKRVRARENFPRIPSDEFECHGASSSLPPASRLPPPSPAFHSPDRPEACAEIVLLTTDKDDARTRDALVNSGACPGLADILLDYLRRTTRSSRSRARRTRRWCARRPPNRPSPSLPKSPTQSMPPSTPNSPRARPATPSAPSRSTPCRWSSTSHAPRRIAPPTPKPGACPPRAPSSTPPSTPRRSHPRVHGPHQLLHRRRGSHARRRRRVAGGGAPRGDADPSRTSDPACHRAAHVLALLADQPTARETFCETKGSFDALAALLEAGARRALAREAFFGGAFVKFAATMANKWLRPRPGAEGGEERQPGVSRLGCV